MNVMDKYLYNILPWILVLLVLHIIIFRNRKCDPGSEYRDTVCDTVWDTIPYYKPIPKDSTVIRYVTVRLPIADDFPNENNNNEQNIRQAGNFDAENIPDSADVVIPITQKVYEDSTYRAWVSGYNARLDSMVVYRPVRYVTMTVKEPPSRFSWGVQMGMGMTPKGLQPYIGIGGQLKF